jgi:hypothetical protein
MASPEKAAEPEIVTQSTEPALEHEQNAAVEQANTPTEIPNEVHSIFSPNNKKFIILTASTAAFFSPLSSNIYPVWAPINYRSGLSLIELIGAHTVFTCPLSICWLAIWMSVIAKLI